MTHLDSAFLFARPSFLEGVARIVDFGNTLNEYNTSISGQQADALAFAADRQALARDARQAWLAAVEDVLRVLEDTQHHQATAAHDR